MGVNDSLNNLYSSLWPSLQDDLANLNDENSATKPFLISFDEEKLKSSELRVMIFGQETKGWKDKATNDLSVLMDGYDQFFTQKFFTQKKLYKGYGKSSFWKAFRFFEKEIEKKYPNRDIYFSWNNINKIGRSKGRTGVDSVVRSIERKQFNVIQNEVALYKPDIVIFLTGPNRDGDIRFNFPDVEFQPIEGKFKSRQVAQVTSSFLPNKTVRLYHPSYFGGFHKVKNSALKLL